MLARLGSLALIAVSLVVSSEICSFLFLHYAMGSAWRPAYMPTAGAEFSAPWYTEDEPWGAWHIADQKSHHTRACFSVALQSNSYGARDRERDVAGNVQRTIVLGDSFAEGFGIEAAQRVSDLLERQMGREFLNFGSALDLGPLQYQLLYEQLSSRFAHDHVLILFLPDNDFTDNDASFWAWFRPADFAARYRPYYQTAAGGYRPYYPAPKPSEQSADATTGGRTLEWLQQNAWSFAAYRYVRNQLIRPGNYSGYFDFTEPQLKAVLWSFAKIKERAGARRVTIVIIPRPNDFRRAGASGASPLHEALRSFASSHDLEIVDLLQEMPRYNPDIKDYFLTCDGHWSATGNAVAARAIETALWPQRPDGKHARRESEMPSR